MTSWGLHTWWWAALPLRVHYCLALPCGDGHASWAMCGCCRGIAWQQGNNCKLPQSIAVSALTGGWPACVAVDASQSDIKLHGWSHHIICNWHLWVMA